MPESEPILWILLILSELRAPPGWNSLGDYPPWLVVLGLTIVAAIAIWIFAKVVKWLLWLLMIAVVIAGLGTALWMLVR